MFEKLDDITKKHGTFFDDNSKKYENDIIKIFNGDLDIDLTNDLLLNCAGLYCRYIMKNYEEMIFGVPRIKRIKSIKWIKRIKRIKRNMIKKK